MTKSMTIKLTLLGFSLLVLASLVSSASELEKQRAVERDIQREDAPPRKVDADEDAYSTSSVSQMAELEAFQPPFQSFDLNGRRLAGKRWGLTGDTTVYRNFVRLVPDYPRRFGSISSKKRIGTNSLYAVLNFRISGSEYEEYGVPTEQEILQYMEKRYQDRHQRNRDYGSDTSLGIWLVHPMQHSSVDFRTKGGEKAAGGNLHGFNLDEFTGIGITIDREEDDENDERYMHRRMRDLSRGGGRGGDGAPVGRREGRRTNREKDSIINILVGTDQNPRPSAGAAAGAGVGQASLRRGRCRASVEYSEDVGAFFVSLSSKIQIVVEGQSLTVLMDERGIGRWRECVRIEDLGFADTKWLSSAFMKITAANGRDATNNYDLFSLSLYPSRAVLTSAEQALGAQRLESPREWIGVGTLNASRLSVDRESPLEEDIESMSTAVNGVMKDMESLEHRIEHDIERILEGLNKVVQEHEKAEGGAGKRIDHLEDIVHKGVTAALEDPTRARDRYAKADSYVDQLHRQFETAGDLIMPLIQQKIVGSATTADLGRSWRLPFAMLSLLLLAGLVAFYLFYRRLKKMHLI